MAGSGLSKCEGVVFHQLLIVFLVKHLILKMQFDQSHLASLFENATEGMVVTNSQ